MPHARLFNKFLPEELLERGNPGDGGRPLRACKFSYYDLKIMLNNKPGRLKRKQTDPTNSDEDTQPRTKRQLRHTYFDFRQLIYISRSKKEDTWSRLVDLQSVDASTAVMDLLFMTFGSADVVMISNVHDETATISKAAYAESYLDFIKPFNKVFTLGTDEHLDNLDDDEIIAHEGTSVAVQNKTPLFLPSDDDIPESEEEDDQGSEPPVNLPETVNTSPSEWMSTHKNIFANNNGLSISGLHNPGWCLFITFSHSGCY